MEPNLTLESKCENLMNIVVESRKRFGKMCIDYDQKVLLMENKILNLQVETVSSYRFKPKNTVSSIDDGSCDDIDKFLAEVTDRQKRIEDVRSQLKNTQDVILQLESDKLGKRLRDPITAEVMLAKAKMKAQ